MNAPQDEPRTSEARLREVTLGEPDRVRSTIELREYDPRWPALYEAEAGRLRAALGDAIRRLEHVGSTAVPGLCAKPKIDVLLLVADAAAEGAYVPALERAGYVLRVREPDWFEHRLLRRPGAEVNVHVFTDGCPEAARMLAFRDRLRAHAGDRERYAAAKRELAGRTWEFVQHYADAKTAVVAEILARADGAGPVD